MYIGTLDVTSTSAMLRARTAFSARLCKGARTKRVAWSAPAAYEFSHVNPDKKIQPCSGFRRPQEISVVLGGKLYLEIESWADGASGGRCTTGPLGAIGLLELINLVLGLTEHEIGRIDQPCRARAITEEVESGIGGNASPPSTLVHSELPTFVLNQSETSEY